MARAVVVGAGLGGLAGAIALSRHGWDVTVLERRAEPDEAGAGIAVWPNALRALDVLGPGTGIGAQARAAGTVEVGGGIRTMSGRWLARTDTADLRRRQGDGVVVLRRPDLHALLRAAAPEVTTGVGVRRVDPGDAARPAVVHDDAGREHPAELVVAADGLRSTMRAAVWPEADAAGHRADRVPARRRPRPGRGRRELGQRRPRRPRPAARRPHVPLRRGAHRRGPGARRPPALAARRASRAGTTRSRPCSTPSRARCSCTRSRTCARRAPGTTGGSPCSATPPTR